jgi:peptidoglycan/LPS O-acetylase OafA/YrhL
MLFAVGGLLSLLLFSVLNMYQKTHPRHTTRNALTGQIGLDATFILLTAFVICLMRALPPACRTAAHRAPSEAGRAYDPLLTLRAFACLMVLIGHGIGSAFRTPAIVPLIAAHNPIWLITSSAEAGVWVFFTLSGYLIGKGFFTVRYTATKTSVAHFYRNRALRILPVYIATITVFSLLFIPDVFRVRNLPVFINMLAFNLNGELPYMPIGALWSISTEMQFYLAAPLIFILLTNLTGRWRLAITLATALAVLCIAYRLQVYSAAGLQIWDDQAYKPLFSNLDLFIAGMITSRVVLAQKARDATRRRGLRAGALALVCLYVLNTYLRAYTVQVPDPAIATCFAALAPTLTAMLTSFAIFNFELAPKHPPGSPIYRIWHPTELAGLLTYATYTIHEPIFLFIKRHVPTPASVPCSVFMFMAVVLVVLAAAYIIYNVVERPFQSRKTY